MRRTTLTWLRALGPNDLPEQVVIETRFLTKIKTYKHDFFAATGLYQDRQGQVVLKIGRQAGFCGFPLSWIGGFLARHEYRLCQIVQGVPGVPRLIGRWGPTGFAHEFVPGRSLCRNDVLPEAFFHRLEETLRQMHARDVAYVDLEKRENILVGEDGDPYLIDFQIAWHVPANRGGRTWVNRLVLRVLQSSDRYHLLKHWRRFRPDQLGARTADSSFSPPFWICWHRAVFRPLTRIRRQILVWLGARDSATTRAPG